MATTKQSKDYTKFKIGTAVTLDPAYASQMGSLKNYLGMTFKITSYMGAAYASSSAYMDVASDIIPSLYNLGMTPYCKFFMLAAQDEKGLLEMVSTLEKEIQLKQAEIDDIKLKLKYMQELGLKEFDDNQFKVYKTLSLLEDASLTKLEKSKIIAKLIG